MNRQPSSVSSAANESTSSLSSVPDEVADLPPPITAQHRASQLSQSSSVSSALGAETSALVNRGEQTTDPSRPLFTGSTSSESTVPTDLFHLLQLDLKSLYERTNYLMPFGKVRSDFPTLDRCEPLTYRAPPSIQQAIKLLFSLSSTTFVDPKHPMLQREETPHLIRLRPLFTSQ